MTLPGTIFYFEHPLGELPQELVLAAAIAGPMLVFFRPPASARPQRLRRIAGAAAVSVDLLIFADAAVNVGFSDALTWLVQYHTRTAAPLEFGSHWRYRLLSEAALMLWVALLIRLIVLWRHPRAPRGPANLWISSWAVLAIDRLIFGINAAPFRDPLYLGHQARETFTHALVTVPLAVGLLLLSNPRPQPNSAPERSFWRDTIWIAFLCAVMTAYQAWGAVATDAGEHARTRDLTSLVCAHWFFQLAGREVAS